MFDYRRDPEGICCHPMRFVMFDEVNRFWVLITIPRKRNIPSIVHGPSVMVMLGQAQA